MLVCSVRWTLHCLHVALMRTHGPQQRTGPVRRGRKEGRSQTRWGWKHLGCSLSQVSDFTDTQDISRTNLLSEPGSEDLPVNDHMTELGER